MKRKKAARSLFFIVTIITVLYNLKTFLCIVILT
jgi:hypothetical protein